MTPYKYQSKKCFDIWDNTLEDRWCIGHFVNAYGQHSALGWLGYEEKDYFPERPYEYRLVTRISDGDLHFLLDYAVAKLFGILTPSRQMIDEWKAASPKRRVCDAWIKGVI